MATKQTFWVAAVPVANVQGNSCTMFLARRTFLTNHVNEADRFESENAALSAARDAEYMAAEALKIARQWALVV